MNFLSSDKIIAYKEAYKSNLIRYSNDIKKSGNSSQPIFKSKDVENVAKTTSMGSFKRTFCKENLCLNIHAITTDPINKSLIENEINPRWNLPNSAIGNSRSRNIREIFSISIQFYYE